MVPFSHKVSGPRHHLEKHNCHLTPSACSH